MPATSTARAPYLLERVGEAAVVQCYADGFERAAAARQASSPGISTRRRSPAATSITTSATRTTWRCATRSRRWSGTRAALPTRAVAEPSSATPSCSGSTPARTTPDGAQVRARICRARRSPRPSAPRAAAGARLPLRDGETRRRPSSTRLAPVLFDASFEPMVTSKTPPPGAGHPRRQRQQPVRGVTLADLDGFDERYALNSRLVKTRRPAASRRSTASAAATTRPSAASSAISRPRSRVAPPAMRRRRSRRWSASTAPARSRIAAPTTSPGSPIATRRSTRSTASSRSTSTRAAARARGRRIVFYVNEDKTRQCQAIADARAVVRGPHAVGPEATASRP